MVELLVVIAITSVLASLLLPALSAAKEKSRRAACGQNIRQFILAAQMYAGDNMDFFPSAAGNDGQSYVVYPIGVSDSTYSNLVNYAGSQSKILDCPNVLFGTKPRQTTNGFLTGYCYLGDRENVSGTGKGPDVHAPPKKATDSATNVLVIDPNVSDSASYTSNSSLSGLKIVPHAECGSVLQGNSSITYNLPGTTCADVGAKGGNVGNIDGSVRWKSINAMSPHDLGGRSVYY